MKTHLQVVDNQLNLVAIYFLVDPRFPDQIRYVGQSKTPRVRHLQHCSETATTPRGEWIESLRLLGIMPQMIVTEWVQQPFADQVEKNWIQRLNPQWLTNVTHKSPQPAVSVAPLAATGPSPLSSLQATERDAIERVLKLTGGNKKEAAKRLGIGRQTLYNKIHAYSLPY